MITTIINVLHRLYQLKQATIFFFQIVCIYFHFVLNVQSTIGLIRIFSVDLIDKTFNLFIALIQIGFIIKCFVFDHG